MTAAPALITTDTFRLEDRVRIQIQKIRERDYTVIGRITAIHWEAQRDTTGLSQSRPRYTMDGQAAAIDEAVARRLLTPQQADALKPFSEMQNILWQSTTFDWLDGKRGPLLARSKDQRDWLMPERMPELPAIPDPRFVPAHSITACPQAGCPGCIAPRIPQLQTGCPVVGDRVEHKISGRDGTTMGVLHPILELSIVAWGVDGRGHFARLLGRKDNIEGRRPALLIDEENRGFFVGGLFA